MTTPIQTTIIDIECGTVVCENYSPVAANLYLIGAHASHPKHVVTTRIVRASTSGLQNDHRTIWVRFPHKENDGSGMDPRLCKTREANKAHAEFSKKWNC